MRLPKNYNSITVGQYQKCYFLLKEGNDIDTWVKVLSELSGKSIDYIENLPNEQLIKHVNSLSFLSNPELNEKPQKYVGKSGKLFKATLKVTDLNTAQGIDIKTFLKPENGYTQQDMAILNAHLILASIYKPLTFKGFKYDPINHHANSEFFKTIPLGQVSGTLFFYSKVWEKWIDIIQAYTKEADTILTAHMEEVLAWTQSGSQKVGNGR